MFWAFHQNGPRTRAPLRKLFGEDWVERYCACCSNSESSILYSDSPGQLLGELLG